MSPDNASDTVLLSCDGVTAGYSAVPIVRDISMYVNRGEIVTVIGPNGSGKSTFLKAVAGQLQLQAGDVDLAGTRLKGLTPERRAGLGLAYVPQNDDVFPALTVLENLMIGGYLLDRKGRKEAVARVVSSLPRLAELRGRKALNLSGGERKLTALGRALVADPSVILLDEPTAGLAEPVANSLLRETVTGLRSSGAGILLVEQRARLALEVADRAYVLVAGAVQHTASAASLLEGDRFATMFFKTSSGAGAAGKAESPLKARLKVGSPASSASESHGITREK